LCGDYATIVGLVDHEKPMGGDPSKRETNKPRNRVHEFAGLECHVGLRNAPVSQGRSARI